MIVLVWMIDNKQDELNNTLSGLDNNSFFQLVSLDKYFQELACPNGFATCLKKKGMII